MLPTRLAPCLACVGLAASLLAACGDDGATGAGGGTDSTTATTGVVATGVGGGESCGPAPGRPSTEACKACTAQHCCSEAQDCAADPACDELETCLEQCGDDASCVVETCKSLLDGSTGPNPWTLHLDLCQLENCQTECNLGLFCEALGPPNDADCATCQATQCCDEAEASYGVDSLELVLCQLECLDWPCFHDCELMHPTAVTDQSAFFQCIAGPQCVDACSGDAYCGVYSSIDATCNACLVSSCCDAMIAASQTTELVDFFTCHINCQGPAECAECATLWGPATAGVELAAENCFFDQCHGACGGPPTNCGAADRLYAPGCSDCIAQSCCTESSACGSDVACASLKVCVALCDGDAACRATCETDFAAGLSLFQDLETCITASCDADCP